MTPPRTLLMVLAAAFALTGGVIACGGGDDDAASGERAPAAASEAGGYVEAAKAAIPAIEAGATLIDVREQAEWDEGHATPAELFTLSRLEAGELPEVAKDAKIYVYCRSGRRADIAVDLMRKAGYTDVTNIGGLTDWQTAGGAVTS
ncbi:MAG: rhodanese-like domain-containing protein [Solirubrobacteraceae bacterium]|nr:rhodanese-like domain-containing protein [Solirubrobacteraceae bacterium]